MKKVLFHSYGKKHCPDGFGAAFAAWMALGTDGVEYIPVEYDKPAPLMSTNDEVFLVDFSYPAEILTGWQSQGIKVTVLDHHKSAAEALLGIGTRLHHVVFDMKKSGAVLAWEHWHGDRPIPQLLLYIQDRDLWTKALPHCDEVHTALGSFDQDFEIWNDLAVMDNYAEYMAHIGSKLLVEKQREIDELLKTVKFQEVAGYEVPTLNTSNMRLVSDALNQLCKLYPNSKFAANWHVTTGGRKKWELRSVGDFDVSAIAKSFGGGGHHNSAGFCSKEEGANE